MTRPSLSRISRECSAIATIAYRDFTKLLRDRPRMLAGLIFPVLFIGVLGTSLNATIGRDIGFDFLTFVFTGVFAQVLFQSSAAGVMSLIEDRENDFSQELFIAPVSRYSIIFGKILGETLVSYAAGVGVLVFGFIIGVSFTFPQLLLVFLAGIAACFFGGAFGVLVLANLSSQRTVAQVFPFILFPQIFLAGIFNPIDKLPFALTILSRATPLTYVVDLIRNAYYGAAPGGAMARAVAFHPLLDITVLGVLFVVFLIFGTMLFIRREQNR